MTALAGSAATGEAKDKASRAALVPLLVLTLAMATGNVALAVFSAVQEQAKAELALSDMQLSLLSGLAVSIPLAILAVPVGLQVDRGVRVRMLLWTALAWTAGTLLTAFAVSLPWLFVARMLGGIGANVSTTIAISLAADLCLPAQRGRALLLLTIGKYAGTGLAFALGGWLLGWFLDHGGIAGLAPWRSIHLVIGLASLGTVAPLLFLREPARREGLASPELAPSLGETFRALLGYRRFLVPLFIGQIGVLMADASATIWAAPVLSRTYGVTPQQSAGWLGAVVFAAGILGSLAGGFAADAGHRTGKRGGILRGAVIASILALPAAVFPVMPSVPLFAAALFCLLLGGTITGLTTAAALAVLLPNQLRGLAVGVFLAVGGLVAFGLSPTLVAAIGDALGGEGMIAQALAIVGLGVSLAGAAGFIVARRNAPDL